ncbi:hypothetical protein NUU61_001897 [Penicillium alfredii]|uniref:F-box domain-containing protein n=1 Tax=Penicillium alfredii TaxID=1506179 RepID=A0A9W9KFH4_9EURO|nr:uncharacterized protein NUU61_001897 [Penicillium alfredii]KAJ5104550.1 hypothetical protein NUU61_001897 [Penicillium alfredii]
MSDPHRSLSPSHPNPPNQQTSSNSQGPISRFGDMPRELMLITAEHLDTQSLINLTQANSELYSLLSPRLQARAMAIALGPRELYERRFTYLPEQTPGIDEPDTIEDPPLLTPPEDMQGPQKEEVLGQITLQGKVDAVRFLLRAGANPNSYTSDGMRMLSLAVYSDNPDVSIELLKHGADVGASNVVSGMTALVHAAQTWRCDMVRILIEVGANANEFNVLPSIAYACDLDVMQMVLRRGGADLSQPGAYGMTALHQAVRRNELEMLSLILQHLPPAGKKQQLNAVDALGRTALHLALQNNNPHLAFPLVHAGIDINIPDGTGNTALHIALKKRHFELTRLFVDRGIDLSVVNELGESELHVAIDAHAPALIRALVDRGSDVNASVPTPMHCAVRTGNLGLVQLLFQNPANRPDLTILDENDRTPVENALALGYSDIAGFLTTGV